MSLADWLETHRRSLLAAAAALALGGLAALPSLPVGLFPAAPFPRVVVSVDSGDRPADRMIIEVTRPIEEAVRGVPGVRNVRSTTSRGTCDVSIDFSWDSDMVAATLQIDSAIAHVAATLPAGTTFETRRMDPFVFPVFGLSLASTADRSQVELRDRALYELTPRSVDGCRRVAGDRPGRASGRVPGAARPGAARLGRPHARGRREGDLDVERDPGRRSAGAAGAAVPVARGQPDRGHGEPGTA